MTLHNFESFAREEWYSASYMDAAGVEYEVVLCRSSMQDLGCEWWELRNVLRDGDSEEDEDLWSQVEQALLAVGEGRDGDKLPQEEL